MCSVKKIKQNWYLLLVMSSIRSNKKRKHFFMELNKNEIKDWKIKEF